MVTPNAAGRYIYLYMRGTLCAFNGSRLHKTCARTHTHNTRGEKNRERERTWTSVSCFQLTARAGSAASKRGESWSMRDRPGLERSSSETHGPRETGGEA